LGPENFLKRRRILEVANKKENTPNEKRYSNRAKEARGNVSGFSDGDTAKGSAEINSGGGGIRI
jgi:hypothetical protein